MTATDNITLYRGEIWDLTGDPFTAEEPDRMLRVHERGALAVDGEGRIRELGEAERLMRDFPHAAVVDYGDRLILPGFVDVHLHFPQLDIIGCYGEQLLGWLKKYTFPAEAAFADPAIAQEAAGRFFTELAANGTTTAMAFASTHKCSVEALFAEAARRGARTIAGKVGMDRHAPEAVLQDPESDYEDNVELIERWDGAEGGRLRYAITPRFAPTCSDALLEKMRALRERYPNLHLQTHYAENRKEIQWVGELFPDDHDYLSVYERHGLLGPRTLLAHAIHLKEADLDRLEATDTAIAHCPTSNFFLGSGLFPMNDLFGRGVRIGLGTDVGGGTSLSLWQTMNEAYKMQQMRGLSISPVQLFYLATLGGARALSMEKEIGNLQPGKWADFQVLDWRRIRLLRPRFEKGLPAVERLFALIMLADDRLTRAVYTAGREIYGCE